MTITRERSAPEVAPHTALARDAMLLRAFLRSRPRDAGFLGEPAFARAVEIIRGQLAPIRSRRALAASFGREACLVAGVERAVGPADDRHRRPLRMAYAVRWLELGDGDARAPWIELVTDRG